MLKRVRRRRGRGWSLRQIHRLRQRRLSLRMAGLLREQARLPCRQAREIRIRRRVAQHARCRWRERLCPPSLRLRLRSTDRLGPRCLRGGFIRLRRSTRVLRGALGWGMARDALAHRLQTVEQPSPILLVVEQAVDLPPVRRLRLLILAQDVIERVRGPHHGRPPRTFRRGAPGFGRPCNSADASGDLAEVVARRVIAARVTDTNDACFLAGTLPWMPTTSPCATRGRKRSD